jgi:hypothetical protein
VNNKVFLILLDTENVISININSTI